MDESPVMRADTATALDSQFIDAVVVCGSHGGLYPGKLVLKAGCRAVIFHDAGGGKDGAGTASLALLGRSKVPAATVDYRTARIGDAQDMSARGVISLVNDPASTLGCAVGQTAAACAAAMANGGSRTPMSCDITERRVLLAESGPLKVWALDSAAQVRDEDAGAILLTGSHGGLLGGRPAAALRAQARIAVFNDAGIGADEAGIGRLAALAERGIAAAAVAASSARIGDGVSTYEDGVFSFANRPARHLGAHTGQAARDLVAKLLDQTKTGSTP